ncbi:MAG: UDP-N-acetylmuramoyl-tripeptide--D-alanyl-D-alanine ligase [Saprospiraceae bacterium]
MWRRFLFTLIIFNLSSANPMEPGALYAIYQQQKLISTDTRKIQEGCIFFALQGSNFDGNSFASEALKLGAAYAVVSDPKLSGEKFIFVADTLIALQTLARIHRQSLNIPVIAITGSNGKTTTKELIACALFQKYKVHSTVGNLNNHIGVPLTLLATPGDTEIIVCEMGANHPGEIASLCKLAQPSHGIITNIGYAHLEGFGSIEGVQKAKGELFEYLAKHEGFGFINNDDERLRALGEILRNHISYGFDESALPDVSFAYTTIDDGGGFIIEDLHSDLKIHSEMFGYYNASNVLAACTVADYFKVPKNDIVKSLSSFVPGANRSETIYHKGTRIIKDAYNANPSSMEMALRAFASEYQDGWVMLGDMKELGSTSDQAHQKMITIIQELGFRNVVLVGKSFIKAIEPNKIAFPNLIIGENIEEIRSIWDWTNFKDQTILLKGSRSMSLEKILES